ncbi:MAG: YitT family protein [Bacillota bacterium]|nr:YitT family protein [Bacillota bacterium]
MGISKGRTGEPRLRERFTKQAARKFVVDMIFISVGCALGAFSSIAILIPAGLSSGGITGIVRIIQRFVAVDFSIMYYAGALIVLMFCAILLGFREARKIILLTILYPAFLLLFEQFPLELLEEKDLTLAAVYCGVFGGVCNGLVFSRGYSFGGTDTIAKIIQKKCMPQVGISKILLGIDAVIIVASGLFYGRNIALYALITQVIASKVIEFTMYGFESKVVQVEVITSKQKEVVDYIIMDLQRGVTKEQVIGGYTNAVKNKVVALCSPRESVLIRQFVARIDPKAFVTVVKVEGVWGYGAGFTELEPKE